MKDYCKRDRMCRRHFLAACFEMDFSVISPRCCDICAGNCACSNFLCSTFPVELYLLLWNRMAHGAEKPRCVSHFLPHDWLFTIQAASQR